MERKGLVHTNGDRLFQCPECQETLCQDESSLMCKGCGARWPVEEDIVCFSKERTYWNQLPQKQMQSLLKMAEIIGWRTALQKALLEDADSQVQDVYDYATDASRADGLFLLPLSRDSLVLDCGSGWGTIAFVLSQLCREVVALDSTYENLRFANIRKRQEGVNNLQLVLASILDHPFGCEVFDAVILNGVLEWVGTVCSDKDPTVLQKGALQNVFALLKGGGYFYLAIENRFGYRYFLGRRDEHSDIRFTSILPRRIADIYSKLSRGVEYRTYTYSLAKYRSLLEEAGFYDIEFFISLPDYRFPRYVIPADDSEAFLYILEHYLKGHPKVSDLTYYLTRLAVWLGLYKYFAPAFIIISRKGY